MLGSDFRCNHERPESKGTSHHLPSWRCRPDSARAAVMAPVFPSHSHLGVEVLSLWSLWTWKICFTRTKAPFREH